MDDKDYRDMVLRHDKHLDKLVTTIELFAASTDKKLDDLISVINTQNVMSERQDNQEKNLIEYSTRMDAILKESFDRVHNEIKRVKHQMVTEGCSVAQIEHQKVKDLARSVDEVKDDIKAVKKQQGTFISAAVVKWGAGILLTYLVIFGTYIVTTAHNTESRIGTHIGKSIIYKESLERRLKELKEGNKNAEYYGTSTNRPHN